VRFISVSFCCYLSIDNSLNRAAKVQKLLFAPTFFFKKKEKGKTTKGFAFFK